MRPGIALFVIGGVFLLNNLGFFDSVSFSLVWPTLLMIAGMLLIIKPTYRCLNCGKRGWSHGATCKECERNSKQGSSFSSTERS